MPVKYRVKSGDSITSLAKQYGINPSDIIAANPGLYTISPGMTIEVPVQNQPPYKQTSVNYLRMPIYTRQQQLQLPYLPSGQAPYTSAGSKQRVQELPPEQKLPNVDAEIQAIFNSVQNKQMPGMISDAAYQYLLQQAQSRNLTELSKMLAMYQKSASGQYILSTAGGVSGGTSQSEGNQVGGVEGYLSYLAGTGQSWAQKALQNKPWESQNVSAGQWLNAVYSGDSYWELRKKLGGSGGPRRLYRVWAELRKKRAAAAAEQTPTFSPTPDYQQNTLYYTGLMGLISWRL
jgi:hypothetical protein